MARSTENTTIICLTGPESSGKSTLARELARTLAAPLVSEFAREYLGSDPDASPRDLAVIAAEQRRREQRALAETPPVLLLDTDIQVIAVWWDVCFGARPPWLQQALAERELRHYLLLYPDLPFEPDPLRTSGGRRFALYARYLDALQQDRHPYRVIQGRDRLTACLAAIVELKGR